MRWLEASEEQLKLMKMTYFTVSALTDLTSEIKGESMDGFARLFPIFFSLAELLTLLFSIPFSHGSRVCIDKTAALIRL